MRAEAHEHGFTLAGACPAVTPAGASRLGEWLGRGYGGDMDYLAERQAAYEHPRHVLDGVRSILMLGMPYRTEEPRPVQPGQGRVSRYAWGPGDYHDLIHERLKRLIAVLQEAAPGAKARGVVDTAPLLEREFAQLAGLGWVGKHTLLINKPAGSYFFLAALLTDQELAYDEPFTADHCGTCRACLDACPTNAFPQPYVLDATRCISYLTIELREAIPEDLRPGIGDWLFGCDVCQEICPWNQKPAPSPQPSPRGRGSDEPVLQPTTGTNPIDLIGLFDLDDEGFRERFRHTPLWRAKRRGILRNAAIVLGNQRATAAIGVLTRGLDDAEPLVRGACAWALAQIGSGEAAIALSERLKVETDERVKRELALAALVLSTEY
ncbi:MAG TPA: tRNA epoxyqueuosine(34) reductase QueG [Pirellulaceae bacterium]|nr:tRNA epoxyqueuosine(34) reductase QueG [Pirellulaceae bacterium]